MAVTYTRANSQADTLSMGSALTWLQAKNGASVGGLYRPTTVGAASVIAEWSTNASGTERISLQIDAAGRFVVVSRRLDTDSAETVTTDGALTAGTVAHIFAVADWANGALHAYLNGVKKTVAVAGWDGASSNTASAAARVGSNTAGTVFANGTTEGLRAVGRALSEAEVLADYASTRLLIDGYDWVHQSFGQAGTAVLARACRPYEGATIGGIATPSASAPVYAADLLERPPESEAQGLSCVAGGSGVITLAGAVGATTNAVRWIMLTAFVTSRDAASVHYVLSMHPRLRMLVVNGKASASTYRLDSDAATNFTTALETPTGSRKFVVVLADFVGGKLRVCVDNSWQELAVASWNAVSSATSSSQMQIGASGGGGNPARSLIEHPRIYSGTGAPPSDEQVEAIRLANGRDIPAPINGGSVAYIDVRGRDGDVAGVMPVLGKVGATEGAIGVATPSGSVHVASTSGLRPVRVETGGARTARQAGHEYAITGANGIARNVGAITLAWWGEAFEVGVRRYLWHITNNAGNRVRAGIRTDASGTGAVVVEGATADADAVAAVAGSSIYGPSFLVAVLDYANGKARVYNNGVVSSDATLATSGLTSDTDSSTVTIGLANSMVSGVHALAASYPFAADLSWVRDQFYSRGARALERASMLFDFTEQPLGPSGIVRCKVNPATCFATPQGTPVPRIVRDTYIISAPHSRSPLIQSPRNTTSGRRRSRAAIIDSAWRR